MALERQPFNLDVLKQLTDELMAPVSAYRHQRSEIAMPLYTTIAKRPRRSAPSGKPTEKSDRQS